MKERPYLIDLYEDDVEHIRSIAGYDWRKRIRNILHQFCQQSRIEWDDLDKVRQ